MIRWWLAAALFGRAGQSGQQERHLRRVHTSTPDWQFAGSRRWTARLAGLASPGFVPGNTGRRSQVLVAASIDAMTSRTSGSRSFSKAHWQPATTAASPPGVNGNGASSRGSTSAPSHAQGQALVPGGGRPGREGGAISRASSMMGRSRLYLNNTRPTDARQAAPDSTACLMQPAVRMATPIPGAPDAGLQRVLIRPGLSQDDQFIALQSGSARGRTPITSRPRRSSSSLQGRGLRDRRLSAQRLLLACRLPRYPRLTNPGASWCAGGVVVGDRTFYWLTFSSTRAGGLPQL